MKAILTAIASDVRKIVFSRKFLAFGAVVVSAWYGLRLCLESENPTAIALFGVFAGMISSAIGVYSFANAKVAESSSRPATPPAT
jgi:hypothetical protein